MKKAAEAVKYSLSADIRYHYSQFNPLINLNKLLLSPLFHYIIFLFDIGIYCEQSANHVKKKPPQN